MVVFIAPFIIESDVCTLTLMERWSQPGEDRVLHIHTVFSKFKHNSKRVSCILYGRRGDDTPHPLTHSPTHVLIYEMCLRARAR